MFLQIIGIKRIVSLLLGHGEIFVISLESQLVEELHCKREVQV